jgi:exopolysaccharide production protein ExoY
MSMDREQVWPASAVKWVSKSTSSADRVFEQRHLAAAGSASERIPLWKRALDLLVIVAFSLPILLVSAILAFYIKLVSPGPVFFRQERLGLRCRRFQMLKFRTMRVGADTGVHKNHLDDLITSDKPMQKMDHEDPRLIPFAKWIRASGLDELPQLFNVILGDMSIVGPRPCTEYEFEKFQPWHKERFHAAPGLTGLWQVSGKNSTTFTEMVKLDISYARQQSLGFDLAIMLKTFRVIFQQVNQSRALRPATVGLSNTTTATTTTTVTRNTGGYEKRTNHRSRRMRVLGA